MSVRILQGDCLDVLRTLPDASVNCCVTSPHLHTDFIEGLCVFVQAFHAVGKALRPWCGPGVAAPDSDLCFDAGGLNLSQSKAVARLLPFDAEKWQQCSDAGHGFQVSDCPGQKRPSVLGVWLGDVKATAKGALKQFRYLRRDLSQCCAFAEYRRASVTTNAHGIGTAPDSDCPVAIDGSGEISKKFCFHATP